jgi:tetratricopeptide (TPR) repeat protein
MAEHPLLDSLLEKLLASDDPTERAAIVAESAFDQLPATMALVARRCVVLRWFDATIIAALVDMLPPAERQAVAQATVATLTTLPFVEQLAWGLAYHDQTRAGLLARIQPVLLQQAAALAIPAYRAHTNRTLAEVEALYCAVASGQSSMATQILEDLLEKAARRVDLQTILTLFQTLDQASALSFAAPMPHKAMHYSLRGLARSRLGDFAEAIADFDQAVALEPDDAMSYVGRGAVRSVRGDWAGAIADFDQAIALNPDNAEAYRRRAMARNAQGDRAGAIADWEHSVILTSHR